MQIIIIIAQYNLLSHTNVQFHNFAWIFEMWSNVSEHLCKESWKYRTYGLLLTGTTGQDTKVYKQL